MNENVFGTRQKSANIVTVEGLALIVDELTVGQSQILSRMSQRYEGFEPVGIPILVPLSSPYTAIPDAFKILVNSKTILEEKIMGIKGAGYLTKEEVLVLRERVLGGNTAPDRTTIAITSPGADIQKKPEKYLFGIQFYAWNQGARCVLKQGGV